MSTTTTNTSPVSSRVIVIGAGIAGMACARELKQREHDVLVLEARNRPGGRLKGMALGPCKVDLGGALIHGISGNPVHLLVKHLNIPTRAVSSCTLLDAKGNLISSERDEKVSQVFNQVLEETFQKSQKGKQGTFGTVFRELASPHLEQFTTQERELFEWHKANLEISCGASFEKLGYRWNDDEPYGYDGDHVSLETSWAAVMDALQEGLNIRYGAIVKQIQIITLHPSTSSRRSSRANKGIPAARFSERHRETQNATRQSPKTLVRVTLTNGNILQADSVVCTVPLGVLKLPPHEGGILFDPPLPLSKQASVSKLGCGLLNKCALLFDYIFWRQDDFASVVPSNRYHLMVNQKGPCLVFWFGGDFAKQMQEWTDEGIVHHCLEVLQTAYSLEPPTVLDYTVTRWGHEQFSRGAFVYLPPGTSSNDLTELSLPVEENQKPVVLFAGEHTTPHYPSTIHGAYQSGIREAYRLDLAAAPALNNYLAFNEESVYKRTFTLKKKDKKEKASEKAVTVTPRKTKQKRVSGEMMLRKRPRVSHYYADTSNRAKVEPETGEVPTRRSYRTTAGKRLHSDMDINPSPQDRETLDDLTLVRSVESYGKQAWELVQSKILPDFSITQLKSRYKKLQPYKKPNPVENWSSWLVERTHEEAPDQHAHGERKSKRTTKAPVFLDM